MSKALRIICDVITTIALVFCIGSIVSFVTIGSPNFYNRYYSSQEVSNQIVDELKQKNDIIAEQNGVEKGAFDYVLSKKIDIDKIKYAITPAIFNGINNNYSKAQGIDIAYREGLIEYHIVNNLDYDENVIENCVFLACENYDNILGADNMGELTKAVTMVSKNAKIVGVISFVLTAFLITRIFALNYGRTKTFSHLGSVLISSGGCFATIFVMNLIVDFTQRLNITTNDIMMGAISFGLGKYFKILAVVGVALIILGVLAIRYTYNYYVKKYSYQLQEKLINEKIRDND